jgi:hypothetical protein
MLIKALHTAYALREPTLRPGGKCVIEALFVREYGKKAVRFSKGGIDGAEGGGDLGHSINLPRENIVGGESAARVGGFLYVKHIHPQNWIV